MLIPNLSVVPRTLVDIRARETTMELWDAWLFAELDAESALKRWWDADADHRGDTFAAYRAALEREARAASALEARLGGQRERAAA
jgi:hypothetical protein